MDGYVSVVPRLLPSEYSSKKIPMIDEQYQYIDNRSIPSYTSPSKGQYSPANSQPLSVRNDFNQEGRIPYSNQPFYSNSPDNSFKGQTNNRFHHEPLKDNSGDYFPRNASFEYSHQINSNSQLSNNARENPLINKSTKNLIITFGIIIGLFALAGLAISIYVLIRITTTTTTTSG